MNEIVGNTLMARDKFMLELHLRQPGITYSAWGPFTIQRKRIQKFKEKTDLKYISKNELDSACFAHDASYADRNGLAERTISDKILRERL